MSKLVLITLVIIVLNFDSTSELISAYDWHYYYTVQVFGYLNTKEEIHYKRILWEAMNGKYTKVLAYFLFYSLFLLWCCFINCEFFLMATLTFVSVCLRIIQNSSAFLSWSWDTQHHSGPLFLLESNLPPDCFNRSSILQHEKYSHL